MTTTLTTAKRAAGRIVLAMGLVLTLGGVAFAVTTTTASGFTVSSSVASQTVAPGGTGGYGISFQATGSFSDNVTLSVSGLPAGASWTFGTNPIFVDPSVASSTTLWINTTSAIQAGSYPLVVTATPSGGLAQTTTVTLNVVYSTAPDFSVEVTPSTQYMTAGSSVSYGVAISGINGFSGSVTLGAKSVPGAVSLGWSPNATTTAQNPMTSVSPGEPATLAVASTPNNPPGTYVLTITATSSGITHSAVVILNIDLFGASGTLSGQVYPGAAAMPIPVVLTDPYNYAITVTGIAAKVKTDAYGNVLDASNSNAPRVGCLASWFKFAPSNLSSTNTVQIPSNGTLTLPTVNDPTISMPDLPISQDACKGVQLELSYVGTGQH